VSTTCPIAYDHTDDLDECMVCGWKLEAHPEPRRPRDFATLTGPERIREAIDRLNGAYAPQMPVRLCGSAPEHELADDYERNEHQ
jgi:hypothetical protein